jgi:heme/copper-type cytochrome/quinol oxidase subunit 2
LSPAALVETSHQYFRLFDVYVPIAIGVFAVFFILSVGALLRYRRRPASAAARFHKNDKLEGAYAVLLTLTVAFLLYLTFSAEHQVDTVANHERPAVTINVVGAKWEWTFSYPAYNITIRSGTTGQKTFVVPVGEPIRFRMTSPDVIHSFWIPELRYKHDTFPGIVQSQVLTFPRAGTFQGQCAQFCGLRHPDMVYTIRAVSPARFRAWASSGGKAPV